MTPPAVVLRPTVEARERPAFARAHAPLHDRVDGDSLEGRKALVIGGYGVANVGDEAILAGLLQKHDLWDATVVSYRPQETEALHGVRAVSPFSTRFPGAVLRAQTLVIGGGGMFSAYMGRFARVIPYVALAAMRMGKRVEFRAFGAYPGTPRRTAKALARAVERADYASVRDESSVAFLRSLGVQRSLDVVPDPALCLEPSSPERVQALLARAAPGLKAPFVVFGVRRVKDLAAQRRLDRALVGSGTVLLRAGVQPLFIPFCKHPYEPLEDDASYAQELCEAIGGGHVLEGWHHPRDVLGIVQEARAMVAVRFHALVFGLRLGVPLVALPYDAKCSDLLRQTGREGLGLREVTARALASRVVRLAAPKHPFPAPRAGLPPADEAVRAEPRDRRNPEVRP